MRITPYKVTIPKSSSVSNEKKMYGRLQIEYLDDFKIATEFLRTRNRMHENKKAI